MYMEVTPPYSSVVITFEGDEESGYSVVTSTDIDEWFESYHLASIFFVNLMKRITDDAIVDEAMSLGH